MEYALIRSRRKTLAIHITHSADVEVRAPLKMPLKEIEAFLTAKMDWIERKVAAQKELLQRKQVFGIDYGDQIPVMGKLYPILARPGNHTGFDGECFYLPPGLTTAELKYSIIQIYQMMARQMLSRKVEAYSQKLQLFPEQVSINQAKAQWGSCSGKNRLNFTWRLIMAEEALIDYVVVHELAHIKEHNHSSKFWTLVGSILPDYPDLRRRLKAFSLQLAGENWEIDRNQI